MKTNRPISILVADDHKLFRQGIASLLAKVPEFGKIMEASDGQEMLELITIETPDVILLDLKMPVLSGLEAMPILCKKYPQVKVLAVSMHTNPSYIARLIKSGACGYLHKDADIMEVVGAIKTVLSGKNYINDLSAEALIQNFRADDGISKIATSLNEEEKNLIKLIVQENTCAQIANQVCLSKRTIDAHRRKLFKKLGVKSVAGLTAFAIEHQLLD